MNTIIFDRRGLKPQKGYPWFDGASWRARYFLYRDKAALLMFLQELAGTAVRNHVEVRKLASDLRRWREERVASVTTAEPAQAA